MVAFSYHHHPSHHKIPNNWIIFLQEHCAAQRRTVHIINLDPAAETFAYEPELDVRDLITVDDVMEMMDLGPNGALVYCMEYLLENLGWLEVCIHYAHPFC